jgi:D-alanyl-D-alanine carboxypeptidase
VEELPAPSPTSATGTPLPRGKLTKTRTATIVLQLVGEGKLRLDDTIERRRILEPHHVL